MSKKRKRHARRRSGGTNPLLWFAGILGLIVLLIVINLTGVFAGPPPDASRSEDLTSLLPLAEARRPLDGEHDMQRIPAQTPAPQPAPAGVDLPRVDIPTTSYDFGTIPGRPDVAHVFAVQNTGTADLEIGNLVTSCGCTTAHLTSSVIPPGQRADLTVVFDPDFHTARGEMVRLVWFATNDPTQPWIEVRIMADVE